MKTKANKPQSSRSVQPARFFLMSSATIILSRQSFVAFVVAAAWGMGFPMFVLADETTVTAEQAPAVTSSNVSLGEKSMVKEDVEPPEKQESPIMRDPFSNTGALAYVGREMGGMAGRSGRIPVYGTHLPEGVRVRGTLLLAGSEPIAVLEIPGYANFFHLQAGDQFSLDKSATVQVSRRSTPTKGKSSTSSATAVSPTLNEWNSPLIFTVEKISRNTVTVSQSRKPDEFIIIR